MPRPTPIGVKAPVDVEDEIEIKTGVRSVGDEEFVIIPTNDGNWQIVSKGQSSDRFNLSKERFTNLIFARQALAKYLNTHAKRIEVKTWLKEQRTKSHAQTTAE